MGCSTVSFFPKETGVSLQSLVAWRVRKVLTGLVYAASLEGKSNPLRHCLLGKACKVAVSQEGPISGYPESQRLTTRTYYLCQELPTYYLCQELDQSHVILL